jgi:hypothetical protein
VGSTVRGRNRRKQLSECLRRGRFGRLSLAVGRYGTAAAATRTDLHGVSRIPRHDKLRETSTARQQHGRLRRTGTWEYSFADDRPPRQLAE